MKKINLLIFILVIIIAVLALTIYLQKTTPPQVPVQQESAVTVQPQPVKKPIVHYPVPNQQPVLEETEEKQQQQPPAVEQQPAEAILPEVLPPVEQSDQTIEEALRDLNIEAPLFKLVLLENFIQRLVATIDTLPEQKLPRAHLPIVPPKPGFIVAGTSDSPQTSRRNFSRYASYVKLMESLNNEFTLKLYIHFYPLFQKAYEQLGYKNAYFNDRLVFVIDHLLETPEPNEPIALKQPVIVYKYADPLLEQLSSGQKMMLRIGPENRKRVKQVLADYRTKLINLQP